MTLNEQWRLISRFLRQLERTFGFRIGRDMAREALLVMNEKKVPRRPAGRIPGPKILRGRRKR